MTQARDLVVVEVDEDADKLAAALSATGLDVRRHEDRALLVRADSDTVYDTIRDTIADLDLSLHRVERQRHQVADLFRDLPTEEADRVNA